LEKLLYSFGKMLPYTTYTDNELFSLLSKDDYSAYTEIYDRYAPLLYMHAYKRLKNREEAKDIIQELFITIWERRSEIELKSNLSAYLYTSIRNRVLKVISHKQVESSYIISLQNSIEKGYASTDYLVREKELIDIIEKEINALPSKMRLVFNLSRKSHLSHKEIAEKLDLSESTVKKQVNSALKVLRVKLQALFYVIILLLFN